MTRISQPHMRLKVEDVSHGSSLEIGHCNLEALPLTALSNRFLSLSASRLLSRPRSRFLLICLDVTWVMANSSRWDLEFRQILAKASVDTSSRIYNCSPSSLDFARNCTSTQALTDVWVNTDVYPSHVSLAAELMQAFPNRCAEPGFQNAVNY